MSWIGAWAIALWGAFAGIVLAHPYATAFLAILAVYLERLELDRIRRLFVRQAAFAALRSARICWLRFGAQVRRAAHRWNEINLFTERNAPSRLAFGIIGAAMVYLSMRLSYTTLLPFVRTLDEVFRPIGEAKLNDGSLGTPETLTLLMIAFDAIVGFILLEVAGVTNIMKLSRLLGGSREAKTLRTAVVLGLFCFLALLGVYEGTLSKIHQALALETACMDVSQFIPECQSLPGSNSASPSKPTTTELQQIAYAKRRIAAIHDMTPYEFTLAVAMPFVLMIIGLSFDFFEELYLPVASLMLSIGYLGFSVVLFLAFMLLWGIGIVFDAVFKAITLPLQFIGMIRRGGRML
ncbi:MAG TPA: hypothetical protein VHL34_23420 [Rhizomicrobium sp.]|jgi:hypothetical protein|nr:hypothetical protein [Rhizomicrobium sp.]